jgi:hypothetical protein
MKPLQAAKQSRRREENPLERSGTPGRWDILPGDGGPSSDRLQTIHRTRISRRSRNLKPSQRCATLAAYLALPTVAAALDGT